MKNLFETIVGLSDHSLGISVATASVALGAKVIEKHFILDRAFGGPDAPFSMEPHEFKQMVQSIREVEKAMGKITYEIPDSVKNNRNFMKSLFVIQDMEKGQEFTNENIRSIRPGYGFAAKIFEHGFGEKSKTENAKGDTLNMGSTPLIYWIWN